jgi:hypothetical protein
MSACTWIAGRQGYRAARPRVSDGVGQVRTPLRFRPAARPGPQHGGVHAGPTLPGPRQFMIVWRGADQPYSRCALPQVCVLPDSRGVTKVPLPWTVTMTPRSRSSAIACRTVVYATPYSSAKLRSLGSFVVISPSVIRRWTSSATWT